MTKHPGASAARPRQGGTTAQKIPLFWVAGGILAAFLVVWTFAWDIARPFAGLHSWGLADGPWYARTHVRYGLGYTHGVRTQAVGNPPPAEPTRYLAHPQLNGLVMAAGLWIFGPHEWSDRVMELLWGLGSLLILLAILRRLVGDVAALAAAAVWLLLPITGYFGTGGTTYLAAFGALWLYLAAIGEFGDVAPRRRHLAGLAAVLLVLLQLSWTGWFFAVAIFVHYVARCVRRRSRPDAKLLGVLIGAPAVSGVVVGLIMLAGFGWSFQPIFDYYRWRAARGEMTGQMAAFDWGAWLRRFWEFALTNFTPWVIAAAALGVVAYVGPYAARRWARHGSGRQAASAPAAPSAQLLLLVLPGVLQLLVLRGALWPHQYWEMPLAVVVAVAAALAVRELWRQVRRHNRYVAGAAVVAVLALLAVPCLRGSAYYYSIRWQPAEKIAMWKQLNRLIPPDRPLLTFDAMMDGLMTKQSEAKGLVLRAEPAWYIDRRIEEAPDPNQRAELYHRLALAYLAYRQDVQMIVQQYRGGLLSRQAAEAMDQRAAAEMRRQVDAVVRQKVPVVLRQIADAARLHGCPVYLLTTGLYHPDLGPGLPALLEALAEAMKRRYPVIASYPAVQGATDSQGRPIRYGMRPYLLFDLRAAPPTRPASRQPGTPQ